MTDPMDPANLPPGEADALDALLGSPSLWDDPPPEVEDRVAADIASEVERLPRAPSAPGREDRRHLRVIAAVAVLFLVLGVGIALIAGDDKSDDEQRAAEVALAGTELAPEASAVAKLVDTPLGLVVLLDVVALAPAEAGSYYQGWVLDESGAKVTIGTFHMRGGDGEIELWGGVQYEDYPTITVTLQQEGAGPESSGMVVLRGRLDE